MSALDALRRTLAPVPPPDGASGNGAGAAAAMKAVAEDTSALIRAEIALAKAELTESLTAKATGIGLLVGAGVAAWLALQAVLVAAGFALALVMPGWAAALVVTAVLALAGAALALVGKKKLAAPVSLDVTKSNIEEDLAWTKAHLPRR